MTSLERISRFLKRTPIDRIGVFEHLWGSTQKRWIDEGMPPEYSVSDYFNYDIEECWAFNLVADLDFNTKIISETDETITLLDGNGATLRRHKLHDSTPEHIDFAVKDQKGYYELIRPYLTPDERRINFEGYRYIQDIAKKQNKFFFWSGVNAFESMHPVSGHEYMLMGMALEPDWIKEMAMDYAKLTVSLMEILFSKEGKPDGIWFYEDMGFKNRPFISPAMYEEIIMPAHIYTIDYAKSIGLPVLMHSCGFVEPLIPGMLKAGIDCLQVIEIKAGMDLLKLHKDFGDRLSLMGGIDVRTLYSNDIPTIEKELISKIPVVKNGFGYCLHSDHSIPETVSFESYKYFVERALELGTY